MKALVTGGGGFLGRYIVERLVDRGDEVSIFSRGAYPEIEQMGVQVIRGDLRDENAVSEACRDQEMVFHVAGKIATGGKRKDFIEINVDGTRNIINACQKHGVSKLIYTSTASVVFDRTDVENGDESFPYPKKFLSYYPAAKATAEKMVLAENGKKGLTTTILRPHLIWGPRDPSLLPTLMERGRMGKLPIFGKGKNKVDLTYVDNVADAHILAADSPKAAGQVYFIGQGEPVGVWDFLEELFRRVGVPPIEKRVPYPLGYVVISFLEVIHKAVTGEEPILNRLIVSELAKSHYFDISKARNELGYEPKISMKEGMDRYVEYLLSEQEKIK